MSVLEEGPGFVLPKGTVDAALHRLFPEPDPYVNDPAGWIQNQLGAFLWSKQIEICESVRDNRFTAVKACHGPGKSYIAARIVAWWLSVHPLGSAFAVTTAPSWPQVQAILWREMRRAHRLGKLPGRITQDCHWHLGDGNADEELVAMGRKPADYDETAFQGIHARYVLAVADEGSGIPKQLFDAIESLVTNDFARVLVIGNPEDPSSEFAELCKPGSGYNVITIPASSTPNFTGEYVPQELSEILTSKIWVEERKRKWGVGSPLYTAKVEAEFPDVSDDTLIMPRWLERAKLVTMAGLEEGQYGADIARFGDDRSVLYRNRGGQVRLVKDWAKVDTMVSTGHIAEELNRHVEFNRSVPCGIDVVGVGAGVFDRLAEIGLPVWAFNGAMAASRQKRFKNKRAESYWNLRTLLEHGMLDLDPDDEELLAQLGSIKYWLNSAGQVVIEPKEEMRDRGLPSPDRADAVAICCLPDRVVWPDNNDEDLGSITGDLLNKVM